jgi:hypothetical protein
MSPADQGKVRARLLDGISEDDFHNLTIKEQLIRYAKAIIFVAKRFELGNPRDIDTGPRNATETANIAKVCARADKVFDDIASGKEDKSIEQVFGAANVARVKTNFAEAQRFMNDFKNTNKIVTDRSGYGREAHLGGLTKPHTQIAVEPSVIDNPGAKESVLTMIHESMHAAGTIGDDGGYIGDPSFTKRTEAEKLSSAAHYEVIARRNMQAANSYKDQPFIPDGPRPPGPAPGPKALSFAEQAQHQAAEALRLAWQSAIRLHKLYLDLYKNPTSWTVGQPEFSGKTYKDGLPHWSAVEALTLHKKGTIDPASPEEGRHPVTQIDMALHEGVVRKLAKAGDAIPGGFEKDVIAFEKRATDAERAAAIPGGTRSAATVPAERDLLIRLALRSPHISPITGTEDRDLLVVKELEALVWADVLDSRPASFP